MSEGLLCQGPVFQDVLTVADEADTLLRNCDGLIGGFPCQDACQAKERFTISMLICPALVRVGVCVWMFQSFIPILVSDFGSNHSFNSQP